MYKLYKVRVSNIQYDIDDETIMDYLNTENDDLIEKERKRIRKHLPNWFDLQIECEPCELDDYVIDEVTNRTGWLNYGCNYRILKETRL